MLGNTTADTSKVGVPTARPFGQRDKIRSI